MKYKVTYYNDFTEPSLNQKDKMIRHISKDQYIVDDAESCIQTVKDFLDVPIAELSLEEVRKEFKLSPDNKFEEEKAVQIQEYYNGRLTIYQRFLEDFKTTNDLQYDIPVKYNSFTLDESTVIQNNAYIRIEETQDSI